MVMTNPPTNAPMIDLRDATKKYDDGPPALAGVTLTVAPGECVAILGHSGSGKSTLLNLIAGLDRPTSGSVTVDGNRVDQLGEAGSAKFRRASIGMIFQFFNLLDDLTVLDNILVPAQLAGMGKAESRRRAAELLGSLGIDRHAKAYPQRLSGGQRQRVAVARALMNRPALLLADEPTGALDSHSAEDVRRLLLELNAEGQTILLVTHDVQLAASTAHRTIELVDGGVATDVVNANAATARGVGGVIGVIGANRGDAPLTAHTTGTTADAADTTAANTTGNPSGAVR
jgi:putative ABC transport system ATP-binding protein